MNGRVKCVTVVMEKRGESASKRSDERCINKRLFRVHSYRLSAIELAHYCFK